MTNRAIEFLLSAKDQTAAAFSSAKRRLDDLGKKASSTAGSVRDSFASLQAAVSVGLFTAAVKQSIDYASAMVDAAAQTNTTVDAFQRLSFAAEQGGSSTGAMQEGLQKISRELAKAKGGGSDFFKNLGIDASKIKDGEDALYKLADAFQAAGDSPAEYEKKLAITRELKLDPSLIPVLSQGSDALKRLGQEAADAGVILDTQTAVALEDVGDKLAVSKTQAQNLGAYFTAGLAPALVDITGSFSQAAGGADLFRSAGETVGTMIKGLITIADFGATALSSFGRALGARAAQLAALAKGDLALAKRIGEELKSDNVGAANSFSARTAARFAGAEAKKPEATPEAAKPLASKPLNYKPKGVQEATDAKALAITKAQAAAEILVRVNAEKRVQALIKDQLEDGKITYADYYAKLVKSQQAAIDARLDALKKENDTAKRLGKKADEIRLTAEIKDLEAERAEVAGDAARAQTKAESELVDELEKLDRRTKEIIGTLSSDDRAEAVREQYKKLRDEAARAGKSAAPIDRAEKVAVAQGEFAAVEDKNDKARAEASRAADRIDVQLQAGAISNSEARAQLAANNEKLRQSIEASIPALEAQAALLGGEYIAKAQAARDEVAKLAATGDTVSAMLGQQLQAGLSDAISSVMDGSKSPAEALKNLFDGVGASIGKQVADDLASDLYKNLKSGGGFDFGGIFSSIFGGGSAGGSSSAGGSILSSAMSLFGFESGGYTGNADTSTVAGAVHGQEFVMSAPAVKNLGLGFLDSLHTLGRRGAPKTGLAGFADGGYTGSGRGSRMGGGTTVIQNITTKDAESFRRSQGQIQAQTGTAVDRATRRNT